MVTAVTVMELELSETIAFDVTDIVDVPVLLNLKSVKVATPPAKEVGEKTGPRLVGLVVLTDDMAEVKSMSLTLLTSVASITGC